MSDGAELRTSTVDMLCEYLGLELCRKKGETTRKQAPKNAAAKRKRRKKGAE